MSIQKLYRSTAALMLALTLAACGFDGSGQMDTTPAPPPPTSFSQFVADQFVTTTDESDPVAVDDEDFAFEEDPTAFDSLLQ